MYFFVKLIDGGRLILLVGPQCRAVKLCRTQEMPKRVLCLIVTVHKSFHLPFFLLFFNQRNLKDGNDCNNKLFYLISNKHFKIHNHFIMI